jgi:hypothetical protein
MKNGKSLKMNEKFSKIEKSAKNEQKVKGIALLCCFMKK